MISDFICHRLSSVLFRLMKVLGIKPSAYQFKKRSLKKVDIVFYTDHPQVEMWPSPPKFLFYQNGFKWSKMHLWSIFFSEKMGFFRPTHPLNLENSRFFLEPFPNICFCQIQKSQEGKDNSFFYIFSDFVITWYLKRTEGDIKVDEMFLCSTLWTADSAAKIYCHENWL